MRKIKPEIILILGCQRSGSTLLAAMLGRHSEINMLCESRTREVFKLIGTKYCGNKLLTWRQIRAEQKASKLGYLINRIVNFHFNPRYDIYQKNRIFPISHLSIKDYRDNNAHFITITRNKNEVIDSIVKRTKVTTKKEAEIEYDKSMREMNYVNDIAFNVDFHDLIHEPKNILKSICVHLNLNYESRMLDGPKFNIFYPHSKIIKEKSKSAAADIK